MPDVDPVIAARSRCNELAESGDYLNWHAIAAALRAEQHASMVISHLGYDQAFLLALQKRIDAAREKRSGP